MLNNLPTDDEKTGGNKNVVLQKAAENYRQVNDEEDDKEKHTYTQNQKEAAEVSWTHSEEEGLRELDPHRAYRG